MNDQPTSLHGEAQKRYEQKQRDRGLFRKTVWVPEAAESEFWEAIDKLRAQWRRKGLMGDD